MTRWLAAAHGYQSGPAEPAEPAKPNHRDSEDGLGSTYSGVLPVLPVLPGRVEGGACTPAQSPKPAAREGQGPKFVASVADVATLPAQNPKSDHGTPDPAPSLHGKGSVGGRARTWTGRVVSLDEWRNLTAWQRRGPERKRWCGDREAWVEADT